MSCRSSLAVVVLVGSLSSAVAAADLPAALMTPYLQVQAALAGDQFAAVVAPAKSIETAAAALGKDGEKLVATAKALGAAKDIAAARTAFGDLSTELVAYAEKTKSGFGADVKQATEKADAATAAADAKWAANLDGWAALVAVPGTTGDPVEKILRDGSEILGPDTPAGIRAAETAEFFEFLQREMLATMDRWRTYREDRLRDTPSA